MPDQSHATPLIALNAVVIDTETTGLDVRTARLIQFGAVRVRNGAVQADERMSQLINPGIPIPARATEVHGIENTDLVGAPTFAEFASEIDAFLSDDILIGHTIAYDLAILRREHEVAGRAWIEPRTLDIRQLSRLAMPGNAYHDLDSMCGELGIAIEGRHSALGDAMATAQAFVALIPMLRAQNIRTLAEADAACRARAEQDARNANMLTAPDAAPAPDADRMRSLIKVDSFPYRHRVRDVMSTPIVIAAGMASIREAAALLLEKKVSSVFVPCKERGVGIVTERDILRAVSANGTDALAMPLGSIATRPLHTVSEEAFVYRAIGRMDRLGIRHLGVINRNGDLVGALTTRNLLRHRAATAMMLGDQIDSAPDVAALARAWAQLPKMARQLLDEEVDARIISAVISSEICNLTRRAARLAELKLADSGRGAPPTGYVLMVLGSAGRGESLLAADQDHAIVYAEGEQDDAVDQWFEALGEEISTILDTVGVPFCKGGVMSKNAAWRMSKARWIETVDRWVRRQRPGDLLNVDIFFDALPVHGDRALAEDLLGHAFDVGRHTPSFIALLSESARKAHVPLTLFRRLRTDSDGRIDLKKYGLFPLVAGARVLAIKHGVRTRATPERLQAVFDGGFANADDVAALVEAHGTILTAMLVQQVADTESGVPLSSRVMPDQHPQAAQARLKEALSSITIINDLVSEGRF